MELKCNNEDCGAKISEKVAKFSADKYNKELCMKCQKKEDKKETSIEKPDEELMRKIGTKTNRNKKDINPDFIVKIGDNEYITAAGLLEIAKQDSGIAMIEVVSLEKSTEKKLAIAHIKITMGDGRVFEDYGSATPDNLQPKVQKYYVEMAVTRARSRALRFGLNVDYCSVEEVGP